MAFWINIHGCQPLKKSLKKWAIVVLTINKTFWEKKYLVMTRNSLLNLIISFYKSSISHKCLEMCSDIFVLSSLLCHWGFLVLGNTQKSLTQIFHQTGPA
jgi:hypothetical protein